ncbi:uncharacterized protein LOC126816802 isoform X2 [Patella vulgata]|uniref:uncharacterized protein LOC126816802 isoform X2 n=1 Tax=Patella vulgata TaxID=6465 RepID=UPI0024A96FF8|nr:uncharacterized protein LOC126816802 isoform X2 [Patella vulgata]
MAGYRNPGYLPHHHAILTENSKLLRTILADGIKNVAHKLNERFVLSDHQLNIILKTVPHQPDDGVFELIKILKGSSAVHFDRFIECLKDLGYLGLVQKLTERHSTSVNTIPQIETRPSPSTSSSTDTVSALGLQTVTRPSPSTSSSTDTGSALVSQTETLHGNTSTEIRVSIIGKTGVGKSALGNALLQHNIFKSQQQTSSVTSECGLGQRHLQLNGVDTLLKVVDTPGLFDTGNSNKTIAKEIVKCINILSPGPHLFIMVFRIDSRLSQDDIKVLEYFKNTFGEMIDKFAVVVFTGKDLLVDRSEDGAIDEFHTHLSTFSDVFKHCPSTTINNGRKDTTEGKTKDVDRILQLLQTTIQKNGGAYYKNEMYEEAKKLFEDQEVVNQNRLAEIAKLTKQIEQLKQREEEQKQREEQQKQREEEHKQRENNLRNWELALKHKEDELSYTEQATTSAYQYESPPRAKRRKFISRREARMMSPEDNNTVILHHTDQRYGEMSGSSQGNQFMIREMADRRHYDVSHSGVGNRSEIHEEYGDLPHHRVILTANSELLRTTLADEIETVARKLHERFVVHDYQLTSILNAVAKQPKDGVSELIRILKGNPKHFDAFIQCLIDLEYKGLAEKLTGRANMSGKTNNGKRKSSESHSTSKNSIFQVETRPTPSTSSSTDTGSALVSQTETLHGNTRTVEYQESPPHAKRRKVIARREKGKMPPEDECRIISNYVYLTENLNPLHPLLDSLIEIYVLNEDDLEKIRRAESSAGTKAMIRQFLDILRTCGRHAYPKFIHCLIKSGYGEVAEQLTSDVDMDGIVKREEKQLRTEKKYLQLQKKLQQIKQESEQAIHISAKENRRIKTTLNSWRIALKTKTNILVRFKSEMRTKTKLLDRLKEERDTRNEDLQMTKVRNRILCDELDRIYEQNVIIDRIKEEFEDDDNGQDVEINKSDYSSVDIQARDGKLLVKQEPLDVHQAEDVNETDDIDRSLPTDDTPVDGITKDKVVENTGLFVKQEPQDVNETCDVTQPTDLWSTTRPDIDQTHEVFQPAGDQQDITTLLTPGHHSPNLESCLQSTSQHQDIESGQPSTSSSLDFSHINQRKDDTTPVKTSPVYDDDKVVRPVDKDTLFNVCKHGTLDELKSILSDKTIDINNTCDLGRTAMFYCIRSGIQPVEKVGVIISSGAKLDVKERGGDSLIHKACEYGCIETVELLLNTGRVDIDSMNNYGKTPIFTALRSDKQSVEKLQLLISAGAKLGVKDNYRDTLLHEACKYGCVETVEWLLNTSRVDVESINNDNKTPIFKAIGSDKQPVEKLELLISYGAKLDVRGWGNNSLLHEACKNGCVETVKLLLNTGRVVDIESKNNDGSTPILVAIDSYKQPVEKLELLISYGAKLDVKDGDTDSLLHVACKYGCVETVKLLLNTGRVDIESKNDDDETPILVAIRSYKQPSEKMRVLANCGANLDVKYSNYSGDSLLHIVCRRHEVEDVEFLLSKSIDIEIRNKANETPIISALRSSKHSGQKVELLLDKGGQLDHSSSILHYACQYGSLDCVKYFIDKGLDIEGRNDENESPLMLAISSTIQSLQKVKVLLDAGAKLDSSLNILHYACQYGSLECVKYFINTKRLDIESRDENNRTPLFYCVLTKQIKFKNKIDLLLSKNVDKMVRDTNNLSVLQFARQHARQPRLQYLIKNGFTD